MASTDATAIPIKNQAYRVTFPIWDADGDLVTGAAGLDSEVSKDGGTFTNCTNEATEIATSSGIYYLDLSATEMNADTVAVIVKTSTSGAKTTALVFYPAEAGDIIVNVKQINGTNQTARDIGASVLLAADQAVNLTKWAGQTVHAVSENGVPVVDVHKWNGTDVSAPATAGIPEVNVKNIANAAVSTSTAQIGVNVIQAGGTAWGSGAITAASIANGAIDNATFAADVGSTAYATNIIALAADKAIQNAALATAAELAKVPKSDGSASWNATALAAINAEVDTALNTAIPGSPTANSINERVATMDGLILGTIAAGTHNPQSGDAYAIVNNGTYGNNALKTLIDTVDNFVDTEVSAIKTVTDKLDTALELDVAVYRFTTNALEQAPTGGSAPTAAAIADAVWDEALSGHTGAGSAGEALDAAGTAGDPWSTALPGAYGAGTAGKIIGDNLNAPVATVDTVVDGIVTELAKVPKSDSTVTWNSTALASIQTECTDALNAYDPPTKAEMDSAFSTTNGKIDTIDDFLDTEVAAILADTNELQTDLANGGRLDLLIDAIKAKTDSLTFTVAGDVDCNVQSWKGSAAADMTGDAYARLGAPAGASVSADVAAVKAQTAAIEADTQDLQTQIGTDGAGLTNMPWNAAWDAEVQSECTDALNAYDPPTKSEMDSAFSTTNGKVDAVDDYVDAEVSAIKAVTDMLLGMTEIDGSETYYRWKGTALEEAPGTDPWATALPGAYGAGTAGKIVGDNINAPIATVDGIVDDIIVDTGTTIPATLTTIEGKIDAIAPGAGAIEWTYTVATSGGVPISGVSVWCTSDVAGTVVLQSGTTNASGVVTFWLAAGTVYVWCYKEGYNFTNPDVETVS